MVFTPIFFTLCNKNHDIGNLFAFLRYRNVKLAFRSVMFSRTCYTYYIYKVSLVVVFSHPYPALGQDDSFKTKKS